MKNVGVRTRVRTVAQRVTIIMGRLCLVILVIIKTFATTYRGSSNFNCEKQYISFK